jgi:hypothetical protein
MDSVHYNVPPPFFWTVAALFVIYMACIFYFFRWMKRAHPDTWNDLGQPSVFWNNSLRNNWLFLGFLFSGRYRALKDAKFAYWIWTLRAMLVLWIILMFGGNAVFGH